MTARTMAPVWTAAALAALGATLTYVSHRHDAAGLVGILVLLFLAVVVLWTVQQRRPEIVWVLYAASMITLAQTEARIRVAGLYVPPPALIAILGIVIIAIRALWDRRSHVVPSRAHAWLALTLLGFAISLPGARFVEASITQLGKWTFHAVLLVLLASMTERRWQLLTVQAIGLATGGLAASGLAAYASGGRYDVNFYEGIGTRSASGMHLAIVLPMLVGLVGMRRSGAFWRSLLIAATALSVCALALTYARAGWVALVAALLVMALVGRQGVPVLGLLVVALGLLVWAPEDVRERFGTIFTLGGYGEDASVTNAIRLELMWRAVLLIRENPIIGVGLGNYAMAIPWYLYDSMLTPYGAVPHNIYLLVWAEGGFLALVGFLGFLWAIGADLWRATRQAAAPARALLTGLLGSWTAVVTFMMFGDDFNHLLVWTVLGLALGIARVWRDEPAVADPGADRAGLRRVGAPAPSLAAPKRT